MSTDGIDHGIPLREAFKQLSDPWEWERFEPLLQTQGAALALMDHFWGDRYPLPGGYAKEYLSLADNLASTFIRMLTRGELVAFGYGTNQALKSAPQRIPPSLWHTLEPNLEECSASGGGYSFAGITVRPAHASAFNAARLRRWFEAKIASGYRPSTKAAMFEEAHAALGDGVTTHAFEEVWRVKALSDWREPGRKPKASAESCGKGLPVSPNPQDAQEIHGRKNPERKR